MSMRALQERLKNLWCVRDVDSSSIIWEVLEICTFFVIYIWACLKIFEFHQHGELLGLIKQQTHGMFNQPQWGYLMEYWNMMDGVVWKWGIDAQSVTFFEGNDDQPCDEMVKWGALSSDKPRNFSRMSQMICSLQFPRVHVFCLFGVCSVYTDCS